jgi:predicted metalloprotease with PDZ domain
MYVLGATLAPAHVALELPAGWDAATGLTPTADPRTFFAPSADVLIDSPILAGRFRRWRFSVDGVPHNIVYWPAPNATPFDSTAFVGGIERLARQTIALFGRAPYREYTFLYQDDSYGGLEHVNSVTLGAPSAELARDPASHLEETAHEFIHTWNLMRIRPAERVGVDYRTNGRSTGLWWSEGLTIYYADLLLRRAGLPVSDTTRLLHLERSIERYLFNPGNFEVSPERASFAEYGGSPGELGDYDPSVHLQGEMLGAMLDLVIRDATAGRRSMDDVMRTMLERFSGERGFTGRDIERTIAEACGCEMRSFFDAYVRAAKAIDFDRYLRLAGLRTRVTRVPALDREGRPAVDMRMVAWQPPGGGRLSLIITNPHGAWGKAGLHTGDRLVSMNGRPIATWLELRSSMAALRIGDTVEVAVERPTGPWRTRVMVAGYDRPQVRIEEIAGATPRQLETRSRWLAGKP